MTPSTLCLHVCVVQALDKASHIYKEMAASTALGTRRQRDFFKERVEEIRQLQRLCRHYMDDSERVAADAHVRCPQRRLCIDMFWGVAGFLSQSALSLSTLSKVIDLVLSSPKLSVDIKSIKL